MIVIIVGVSCGLGLTIWYYFHDQLTNLLRWIRVCELWIVTLIHGSDYTVMVPQTDPPSPTSYAGPQPVGQWRDALMHANVKAIGIPELRAASYMAVPPLRPLFGAILVGIGFWRMFRDPKARYTRKLDLEGLIREQSKTFPNIRPFVKFDPRKTPFRVIGQAVPAKLPLFAEALSPEEWVSYNEIELTGGQLDPNKTYQALASQLRDRWQGPMKMPIHMQGLYAAFALRHARKRNESEDLLGELATYWTPETGLKLPHKLIKQIHRIIKDPKLGGAIQKHADMHAYTVTALLRCLARAREEGGVLAPAAFLWLRGEDRELWYPLNNLGRKAYHMEAVGALIHYSNELIAAQKMPTPRFDEVIKAVQDLITGPGSRPIPPLDRTPPPEPIKRKKTLFEILKSVFVK